MELISGLPAPVMMPAIPEAEFRVANVTASSCAICTPLAKTRLIPAPVNARRDTITSWQDFLAEACTGNVMGSEQGKNLTQPLDQPFS